MKSMQAIRRFISTSWLVAAPLVIVVLLIVGLALLGIVDAIVGSVFGAEAADNFIANAMVLFGMAFELGLLGLVIYAMFCVARWLLRKKER
jgi:uncharacterized membrane protein